MTNTITTMNREACTDIRAIVAESNLAELLKAAGIRFEFKGMTYNDDAGEATTKITFSVDGALGKNALEYQQTARMARMDPMWLNKPITMADGKKLTIVGWNSRARTQKVDVLVNGREMKCTASMARDEYERVFGKYADES